jgi:hypothetical protein
MVSAAKTACVRQIVLLDRQAATADEGVQR